MSELTGSIVREALRPRVRIWPSRKPSRAVLKVAMVAMVVISCLSLKAVHSTLMAIDRPRGGRPAPARVAAQRRAAGGRLFCLARNDEGEAEGRGK